MSISDTLQTIKNVILIVTRVVEFADKLATFLLNNVKGV